MIKIFKLVNTYCTQYVSAIESRDVEYKFRIEVWYDGSRHSYFASVSRAFLCEMSITSENGRLATEEVWTTDHMVTQDKCQFFPSEAEAYENALGSITALFEDIPDL
jgi:hypothetical protein